MMYSFDDAHAKEQRRTQYFEMFGNRALYHDGWIAAVRHGRLPWENAGSYDFDKDVWELYNVDSDFSESNDVSKQNPQKLKELQDMFWVEAKKYNVLPLDDRFVERANPSLRPSLIAGRTKFTYLPGTKNVPESSAANIKNTSHTITAYVDVPKTGGDGVIVAQGGVAGGYAIYVKDGRPVYEYNWFGEQRYRIKGAEKLAPGPNTIRLEFKYDGGGIGKGGNATLSVNGKEVGKVRLEKTVPARFTADETFDLGMDAASPVSPDYPKPSQYTGTIKKVEIELVPAQLSAQDEEKVRILAMQTRLGIE